MLSAVAKNTPDIYRFCYLACDKPTHLKFFGHTILLQEDDQQGDPLGPLLFCLSIHSLLLSSKSHLKIAYMVDFTLGSPAQLVAADVTMIKTEGAPERLILKMKRSVKQLYWRAKSLNPRFKNACITPAKSMLLGAPLSKGQTMDNSLSIQCNDQEKTTSRLGLITVHDALVLREASFNAPKFQRIMRAAQYVTTMNIC